MDYSLFLSNVLLCSPHTHCFSCQYVLCLSCQASVCTKLKDLCPDPRWHVQLIRPTPFSPGLRLVTSIPLSSPTLSLSIPRTLLSGPHERLKFIILLQHFFTLGWSLFLSQLSSLLSLSFFWLKPLHVCILKPFTLSSFYFSLAITHFQKNPFYVFPLFEVHKNTWVCSV